MSLSLDPTTGQQLLGGMGELHLQAEHAGLQPGGHRVAACITQGRSLGCMGGLHLQVRWYLP